MQKLIILTIFFVALCSAQQAYPGSITQLTPGSSTIGVLTPQLTSSSAAYNLNFYSIWVPENATMVNYTLTNTNNADCSWLQTFIKTGSVPCSQNQYSPNGQYPCADAYQDDNAGSSPKNQMFTPGDAVEGVQFDVGTWWYIGVGRWSISDYSDSCTYSLKVDIPTTCASGSVALEVGSDVVCSPYTAVSTYPATMNVMGGGVDSIPLTYKLMVPTSAASVIVSIWSPTTIDGIYAKSYSTPSSDTYDCYTTSSSGTTGNYTMFLQCFVPRSGVMYVTVADDDTMFNGTMNIRLAQCSDSMMMGGYNCSEGSWVLNTSMPTPVFIQYMSGSGNTLNGYTFAYYYLDIVNYTGPAITITAQSGTGSGYLNIRRDGYPQYNSATYDYSKSLPATLTLNSYDLAMNARWYFSLYCGSGNCSYTLSSNLTSGPAAVTTGMNAAVTTSPAAQTTGIWVTTNPAAVTTGLQQTTGITTNGMTTNPGMTTAMVGSMTTGVEESSVSVLVPTVFLFAIISMLF